MTKVIMARPKLPRADFLNELNELKLKSHRQVGERPRTFGGYKSWRARAFRELRGGPPQPPIPGGRAQLIADAKFAESRRGSQVPASKREVREDCSPVEHGDGIRQYRRKVRPPAK